MSDKVVAPGTMTAEKLCLLLQKTSYSVATSLGPLEVPGDPVPAIVCADGFRMSVQADKYTYCRPRQNQGPWTEVEVGFPSAREEALMPYIDGGPDDDPTKTVYGYVPVKVVVYVINRHGGVL